MFQASVLYTKVPLKIRRHSTAIQQRFCAEVSHSNAEPRVPTGPFGATPKMIGLPVVTNTAGGKLLLFQLQGMCSRQPSFDSL